MTEPVGVAEAELLETTLLGIEEVDDFDTTLVDELDDDCVVVEEEETLLVDVVDFLEVVLEEVDEMTIEETESLHPDL